MIGAASTTGARQPLQLLVVFRRLSNVASTHSPSQVYLRFLHLMDTIRAMPAFPRLDPVEERVLNALASVWARGGRISVLQAMDGVEDLSPSTVHRRLKTLRAKGMVMLDEDHADSRTKYIVPTELGERYFAQLGRALDRALRGATR